MFDKNVARSHTGICRAGARRGVPLHKPHAVHSLKIAPTPRAALSPKEKRHGRK